MKKDKTCLVDWQKDVVCWQTANTLYISVVFTWDLPKVKEIADETHKKVVIGGPAAYLMPDYLKGAGKIERETPYPILAAHHPFATFTSRGCPNKCGFCAVPKIEGDYRELETFDIRPIVCDNNLLASSDAHFNRVIDALKVFPYVDFNQGLDASLFTKERAQKIAELKHVKVRFAFDSVRDEAEVIDAINLAKSLGMKDINVYVLIGFNDTPDDAQYRLELIKAQGALPDPMRYQPLNSLTRNAYVNEKNGWSDRLLKDMQRFYYNSCRLGKVTFEEYRRGKQDKLDKVDNTMLDLGTLDRSKI